jgi:tetratricopeptide (TPR) repeat protein
VVKNQPPSRPQPVTVAPPKIASTDAAQVGSATNSAAPAKGSFWDKLKPTHWFAPTAVDKKYENAALTPLASDNPAGPTPATPAALPAEPAVPMHQAEGESTPPAFARYGYQAPGRPAEGDHRGASGAFTRARVLEQASQWVDAMQAYRTAAELDPSWFEAQYNYGVLSYRLGNQRQALAAYEMALAIQPDSVDARYNFALALKAAGYVPDAVNELKKVLAGNPVEVRAHLALANLYAQKMHDPVQAREHYLKVLDLDPNNPQAPGIRNWLSSNSE